MLACAPCPLCCSHHSWHCSAGDLPQSHLSPNDGEHAGEEDGHGDECADGGCVYAYAGGDGDDGQRCFHASGDDEDGVVAAVEEEVRAELVAAVLYWQPSTGLKSVKQWLYAHACVHVRAWHDGDDSDDDGGQLQQQLPPPPPRQLP